ncbi:hypothetical protein [Rhodopseudomonas telluris]|uniref:Uncharacterized protein n=1 Tax=Rhodopseudomonas telluris TaxID=644215 RepID=A0ABV6EVX6_9BRAD
MPKSMSGPSWKLLPGPADQQGRSAVSITRIADTQNSDPEMVGLMIRCSPPGLVEVAVVVVPPFAPKSRPSVAIDSSGDARRFEGRVAPGGTAVILPDAAAGLAAGPWQNLDRVTVKIDDNGRRIGGQIELDGLPPAYAEMKAKCVE